MLEFGTNELSPFVILHLTCLYSLDILKPFLFLTRPKGDNCCPNMANLLYEIELGY